MMKMAPPLGMALVGCVWIVRKKQKDVEAKYITLGKFHFIFFGLAHVCLISSPLKTRNLIVFELKCIVRSFND